VGQRKNLLAGKMMIKIDSNQSVLMTVASRFLFQFSSSSSSSSSSSPLEGIFSIEEREFLLHRVVYRKEKKIEKREF